MDLRSVRSNQRARPYKHPPFKGFEPILLVGSFAFGLVKAGLWPPILGFQLLILVIETLCASPGYGRNNLEGPEG